MKTLVCAALAALLPASAAFAQAPQQDVRPSRFQLGPVGLTPRVTVQNLGIDTNVFNAAGTPVKDVTATVSPGLDTTIRLNRVTIINRTTTDWIHYQKVASQRSFDLSNEWLINADLVSAVPRLFGQYVRTRQRPNDEIDERVQQKVRSAGVGVLVPFGSRWSLDAEAEQTSFDYAQGQYGDPELAEALNRDSNHVAVALKTELTPLTAFSVRVESIRDRFVFTKERDSDSIRVMPGFTFRPFALVSGSAFVGFRQFKTLDPLVPNYTGLVAAVELKYVYRDSFRLTGQFNRDVDYSLDLVEPFMITTSAGIEATQMIGFNWDIVGRARLGTLAYPFSPVLGADRRDRTHLWGLGVGRRLGDALRVGVDVNYATRASVVPSRTYSGFRIGGSFAYGY